MADGELFTTFVDSSPALSLPVQSTDEIAIVRGAVTYKVAPTDLGGGGSGTVGPGTVGYVSFFTGTNTVGDSSIKDTGTASSGVVLTLGTLTTPDNPGTYGTGVSLAIQPGASGSLGGYGGGVSITGGSGVGTPGYGGAVLISGGTPSATGIGGAVTITGGPDSNDAGSGGPGAAALVGGSAGFLDGGGAQGTVGGGSGHGDGPGGAGVVAGGLGQGSGQAGGAFVTGGFNSSTGKGGNARISGGQSAAGDAGDVIIETFAAGAGNNGDISLSSQGDITIVVLNPGSQNLIINGLPTSAAGLTTGMIWLDSNVLTRVP
jgi:hypothetical protein